MGESIAWPGQVPGLQDVQGGCLGETGDTATGKNLSPKQPGLEDWSSHPTLKANVVVESTSYLSPQNRQAPIPTPQGPRSPENFCSSSPEGGKGLKVPVLEPQT